MNDLEAGIIADNLARHDRMIMEQRANMASLIAELWARVQALEKKVAELEAQR